MAHDDDERFRDEEEAYRSLSTDIAIGAGPAVGAATAWALNKFGGSDDGGGQQQAEPANDPPPSDPPNTQEE